MIPRAMQASFWSLIMMTERAVLRSEGMGFFRGI